MLADHARDFFLCEDEFGHETLVAFGFFHRIQIGALQVLNECEREGRAELVSDNDTSSPFSLSEVPISILPILEILPVQMITLALAAHARREPGRFELASKVTTAE